MPDTIFFWSWPTWAKLSFALGGSLIVVLTLAGIVKLRKIIRTKKLNRKAVVDLETANIRLRKRSSDEVPFGAKAMYEDPDIEGVWNSRASTPLQSPVIEPRRSSPSRNPFSRSRRNSSISSLSHLNLQDSSPGQPTTPAPVPPPGNFNGTATKGASPLVQASPSVPLCSTISVPHSLTGNFPRQRSVTIRATSKQDAMAEGLLQSQSGYLFPNPNPKRRARVSTDPIPATPTHERHGRTLIVSGPVADAAVMERTPTTRKALDRMEAHRKFHAAESGQLQPRGRNLAKNSGHKHSTSEHTVPEHEITRAVSWPITSGEVLVDFKAPRQVQPMTSPRVVPFRAVLETQTPPRGSVRAPPSAWTERTQGMLDEKLEFQASKRRITIKNSHGSKDVKDSNTNNNVKDARGREETTSLLGTQRRQINKGFEILPAGSLENFRPMDLNSGNAKEVSRNASDKTSKPKKLRKKSISPARDG